MHEKEMRIMDRDTVINELKELLVEELDLEVSPEEIDENASFVESEMRLDSLDFLTIAAAVEDKYEITLDFKNDKSILTVAGIADHIMNYTSVK